MTRLQPYSVYAHNALDSLSQARDWLKSEWPEGHGPDSAGVARGRIDALLLMGYVKAAIEGKFQLTEEMLALLSGEEG